MIIWIRAWRVSRQSIGLSRISGNLNWLIYRQPQYTHTHTHIHARARAQRLVSSQLLDRCSCINSPVCVLWWAFRCELLVYTFLHPGNWHLCILRFVSGGLCSLLLAWCLLATVVVVAVVPACACCVPATAGKPFAVTEISLKKYDLLPLIGCILATL